MPGVLGKYQCAWQKRGYYVCHHCEGLKLPCALDMAGFRNTCGHPEELHDKEQTIVPLRDLEQIADACLAEGRAPVLQPGRACPG